MGTFWADVSQYQRVADDSYPHRVFSFRTNSGDQLDRNAATNLQWALRSKCEIIIAYYFFRPGQANCDLWREVVAPGGKIDPRIVCMVDVEGDRGTVSGDNSAEINDEVRRVQGWLGGKRVIGYLNPKSDPGLWVTRPGIPLVIPHYNGTPGQSYDFPDRFAHQYSDAVQCTPFGPCDANFTALSIDGLKALFGITSTQGDIMASLNQDQANAVAEGGGQLLRYPGVIRIPSVWLRRILGRSWLDKEGPRFADAFGAVVNEIVWDGYDFTSPLNDIPLDQIPDEQGKNLVTMVRIIGARQSEIDKKLDRLLAAIETKEK